MLTEQELAYQIAIGNEDVFLDDDVISIDIPQIEMQVMMIHNALINMLNAGNLQPDDIDWSSFASSIFGMNHGLNFINRIPNERLKAKTLRFWIDNLNEFIGIEKMKDLWISEWENLCK